MEGGEGVTLVSGVPFSIKHLIIAHTTAVLALKLNQFLIQIPCDPVYALTLKGHTKKSIVLNVHFL